MAIFQRIIKIHSRGRGTYALTNEIQRCASDSGVITGICNVFVHHTSASLILTENADPQAREDLERFLSKLVMDGDPMFHHDSEGPDDMAAHIRSVLTQNDMTLPITQGRCALGTWQGVFLWEHRYQPHGRTVTVTIQGE